MNTPIKIIIKAFTFLILVSMLIGLTLPFPHALPLNVVIGLYCAYYITEEIGKYLLVEEDKEYKERLAAVNSRKEDDAV